MSLSTPVPHAERSHMKPQVSEAFAAFVGLDWADAKHAICLQAAGTVQRECLSLAHSPEAVHTWVQTLRMRFNGFDHGVGHSLLVLCDAKAPHGKKWNDFKALENYLFIVSISLS